MVRPCPLACVGVRLFLCLVSVSVSFVRFAFVLSWVEISLRSVTPGGEGPLVSQTTRIKIL